MLEDRRWSNHAGDRREFLMQAGGALAAVTLLPSVLPAAVFLAEPMNVGVVGIGRQGRAILTELAKIDKVQAKGLCDVDQARLDRGVRQTKGALGFTSHKEMLEKTPDLKAVFVATPTHLHKQVVADCLAAGKHVYCEAPMAHTLEECRDIVKLARANGKLIFQVGLEGRSNPIYNLARKFYRAGSLRKLVSMRAQAYQKTSWRFPASEPAREKALNWRLDKDVSIGLPGELGTLQFDVFHWYTDMYPTSVSGLGSIRVHEDGRTIPDTVQLLVGFEKGESLAYLASLGNSFEGRHEILHGEDAAVKLAWTHGWMFKEADAKTEGWEVYANRQQFHNDEGITLIADATKLAAQGKLKDGVGLPNPSLYYAINDFFASVTEGKEVVAPAEEGLRATAVGIAAHQAVMEKKTIAITPQMMKA